ncbi:MAG: saccharopine dehydrogenase C-terminal domain-containing protein [Phycisphaerales bacterium]|jgi:saccharopine dehydrogenase-like NADP-dependent oxidoreductase|nr:saccharopine dehydrogenase C-terminal domain-containing protein [Phycisphaerales bacterium]
MKQTVVLGGGMVGAVMAMDLAADPGRTVTLCDVDGDRLRGVQDRFPALRVRQADLSDQAMVRELASEADLVLGALPSRFGLGALQAVIETGKPYCDISFMPEDAWRLDEAAKASGTIAVVDCGVAPGMSNLLAGVAARRLSPCRSVTIRVGGLPVDRHLPWQFKAAFSPYDIIEEYVRPARIVEQGQVLVREALSDPILIDFPETGTLEAFNTDGLRSLTETLDVPNMLEQTMRYPGHRDLAWALRETGLLSDEPIDVGGVRVSPREVTCRALFPLWTYEEGEGDLTVMRVEAQGDLDGIPTNMRWDLYDEMDPERGWSSMARTTAFPATIMARMIESGIVSRPGVHPPECLAGDDRVLETLFSELSARGVTYRAHVEPIPRG